MTQPGSDSPELHGLDPGELLARGLNTPRPSGGLHDWTPPTPEELSRLLPQYHIERMLGHGGMGAVYQGRQEKLHRSVALKILPAELTADEQFVARFEREARTLAQLQHPGIVSIYDFGQTSDGHLYFVMEYVEGTDLRRILQGPGLQPAQALEIIVQICEALQAAHRRGVVHRDIKPANILLTLDGRVKLADFGLARLARDDAGPQLTCTNDVLGTPDYMAPEQHSGSATPADHRADIFALGLTLYEMLTGQLPRGAFVPPSQKVQVDVRIDEVVLKALQEQPHLRYQQASEMKTDVDHIRSGVHPSPPSPGAIAAGAGRDRPFLGLRYYALVPLLVLLLACIFVGAMLHGLTGQYFPTALPSASASSPTPRPESSSPHPIPNIREALLSTPWVFATHYTRSVIVFAPDGTVRNPDGTPTRRTWSINSPRSFVLRDEDAETTLTFDDKFTQFEGRSLKARGRVSGTPVNSTSINSNP